MQSVQRRRGLWCENDSWAQTPTQLQPQLLLRKNQEIVQVQLLWKIDNNPNRNDETLNDKEMLKGSSVEK